MNSTTAANGSRSSAAATTSDATQFSLHTILIALRCWWKIAFPVGLVLAVAAAAGIYLNYKPTYTAEAWLFIKGKPDVILRDIGMDSGKFIQNQMETIRSPRLLGPLASNPEILSTPELRDHEDVVGVLAKQIKIAQRGQSDLYVISFASTSAEKAQLVVEQVVNAYMKYQTEESSEQETKVVELLEKQRRDRGEEMKQLRENVRAMSVQLTGVDPFRDGNSGVNADKKKNPLAGLQDEIVRGEVENDVLQARIQVEEERQASNKFVASESEIESYVNSHPAIAAIHERIESARQKEAEYQKTAKSLATNPLYKQLQEDIASGNRALEKMKLDLRKQSRESMERQIALAKADKLRQMKEEHLSNETRLSVLQAKFKEGMASAKQYAGGTLELEFARAELGQVTGIYDEISMRILAITTEQRAPERVKLLDEVKRPLRPRDLGLWKKVMLGAGAGFAAPFLLAIGWEQLFRRVSASNQLESSHRLAVVGEVTSLPTRQSGSRALSRADNTEMLLFEESVDGLRTYLSLMGSLRDLRILAVTSAVSGEGKTCLSSQLAVSIARATGEPTLLIDGDMRYPDLHAIFETELSPGLVDVLRKECPLEEAIETEFSEKLHVLTAGRLTTSPHRLVGGGEFQSMLLKLSAIYRHIIIDTPPVLASCEALVMASAADAAIICVRRDYSRMDQVRDAYAKLESAGVKVAGAVFNGIPIRQYASKYGSYAYHVPASATNRV